jgi:hypothetical protein
MDVVNRLEFGRGAGMLERALPWDRGLGQLALTFHPSTSAILHTTVRDVKHLKANCAHIRTLMRCGHLGSIWALVR